jgi:exodeoxyribonuclease VIII
MQSSAKKRTTHLQRKPRSKTVTHDVANPKKNSIGSIMGRGFDFSQVTSAEQPQNNIELMLDVEAFGTTVGSPVVTIGAVLFDPFASDSSQELSRRAINVNIDISEAIDYSMGVSGETIRWWFEQKDDAIKALVSDDAVSVKDALLILHRYCLERGKFTNDLFFEGISDMPKACQFWANDPDFDMRLMEYYYTHPDLGKVAAMPWKFWNCNSVRTVERLAWPEGKDAHPVFEVPGVAHDARWDAIQQAMRVQAGIRRLGIAKDQDVQFGAWPGAEKAKK